MSGPTAGSTSSTEHSGARGKTVTQPGRVVLGRVVGAHGLRGQVRVRYFGDGPEHLLNSDELWLCRGEDGVGADRFSVEHAGTGRGGEARLTLRGVDSRESAISLRGRFVLGDPDLLEALPEGEFYWYQLIGCRVEDGEGVVIGTVREILETGAHDVLVVEASDGTRHLLPAAQALLPEIDIEARRLVVERIPGLLDPA